MQDFINGKRKKESGFTIIEVVLVLAIAGLIFLIVFLALPQLQRSRRDTQRRGDAGKVLSSLESYAANAGGVYPTSGNLSTFVADYVTNKVTPPGGGTTYNITWSITAPTAVNAMVIRTESKCNGAVPTNVAGDLRAISVTVKLEEGTYCQDNQ